MGRLPISLKHSCESTRTSFHIPSQEIQQIFIETRQVKIVLPSAISLHRVCICWVTHTERVKRLYKIPPLRLYFIFVINSASRVMNPDSVWDWRCTSRTKWVSKWAAAGAIWQWCCKMPRRCSIQRRECCEGTSNNRYFPKQPRSRRRHLEVNVHVWLTRGA